MRRIVDAVPAGPGADKSAGGATRRRKPYLLISCRQDATSQHSASLSHSMTTQRHRRPVPWRWS